MAFDIEKFLNTPLYAFDQRALFGDIEEFLEFSENNIALQKQAALQEVEQEMAVPTMEEPDWGSWKAHQEETVAFRFDVVLPMRVRYAALNSLISTIEWSVAVLAESMSFDKLNTPKDLNRTIFLLNKITALCQLDLASEIGSLKILIWMRNCITHNAGLLKGYEYTRSIRNAISRFEPAIKISNWHFIGDTIEIRQGALEPFIERWSDIIYDLYKVAHEKKLVS